MYFVPMEKCVVFNIYNNIKLAIMAGRNHVRPDIPMRTMNSRSKYVNQTPLRIGGGGKMANYTYDR